MSSDALEFFWGICMVVALQGCCLYALAKALMQMANDLVEFLLSSMKTSFGIGDSIHALRAPQGVPKGRWDGPREHHQALQWSICIVITVLACAVVLLERPRDNNGNGNASFCKGKSSGWRIWTAKIRNSIPPSTSVQKSQGSSQETHPPNQLDLNHIRTESQKPTNAKGDLGNSSPTQEVGTTCGKLSRHADRDPSVPDIITGDKEDPGQVLNGSRDSETTYASTHPQIKHVQQTVIGGSQKKSSHFRSTKISRKPTATTTHHYVSDR